MIDVENYTKGNKAMNNKKLTHTHTFFELKRERERNGNEKKKKI